MPVLILGFFSALLFAYASLSQAGLQAQQGVLQADQKAVSFLAYKAALVSYLREHPGHSGLVPEVQLKWPSGYVKDAFWAHRVEQGTLYVYSASPIDHTKLLPTILAKTSESLAVGTNANCHFLSARSGASALLPANLCGAAAATPVPEGALVVVGQ